jgi:hypothetical protein
VLAEIAGREHKRGRAQAGKARLITGLASAALISLFSLPMISAGVFGGHRAAPFHSHGRHAWPARSRGVTRGWFYAMYSLRPPPMWALLIGAAVIMLALLLVDMLIPGFDWIGR